MAAIAVIGIAVVVFVVIAVVGATAVQQVQRRPPQAPVSDQPPFSEAQQDPSGYEPGDNQ